MLGAAGKPVCTRALLAPRTEAGRGDLAPHVRAGRGQARTPGALEDRGPPRLPSLLPHRRASDLGARPAAAALEGRCGRGGSCAGPRVSLLRQLWDLSPRLLAAWMLPHFPALLL